MEILCNSEVLEEWVFISLVTLTGQKVSLSFNDAIWNSPRKKKAWLITKSISKRITFEYIF